MNSQVIGTALIPDGYNGKRTRVHLVFHRGVILEVHPHGYHRAVAGPSTEVDADAARWLVANHPGHKRRYMDLQVA